MNNKANRNDVSCTKCLTGMLQHDIHIQTREADERKRAYDVDNDILQQVEDLATYFNQLYNSNNTDIRSAEVKFLPMR